MIAALISDAILIMCTLVVIVCSVNLVIRLKQWRSGDRVIVHRSKMDTRSGVQIDRHDQGIVINRNTVQLRNGETLRKGEANFLLTKDMENFGPIEVVFDGAEHHCSYREMLEDVAASLSQVVDAAENINMRSETIEVTRIEQ